MERNSTIEQMPTARPWKGRGLFIVCLSILIGSGYIVTQWIILERVDDPFFVGILMANCYAVYHFTRFLRGHLQGVSPHYEHSLTEKHQQFQTEKFLDDIFHPSKSFIFGIFFGFCFFLATMYLMPWGSKEYALNILLGVFLMISNIVIGMAIYSLFVYFTYSLKLGSHIDIDLWDRSSDSISALIDTNRYVVLATAFIAFAGMISILDSKFKLLDALTYVFSMFSIFMILLAYIVPLMPLTTQLRRKKKENMKAVGKFIEDEYRKLLDQGRDSNCLIDISRFDALSQMYRSVKSVRAFPPIGEQSINTAFLIAFLTVLPAIIEKALPYMQRLVGGLLTMPTSG